MGKRISKIEKPHGQNPDTTSYAYDGIYAVCEFGGHLDLHSKYVYANGMLLARYDAVGDTHYYHHDGLGSVMGMTDENKSVEQSYFYDEFGNALGSCGSVSNYYLYTGQEYDGSITQLYNLRARYYKPIIGRFISEDPMFMSLGPLCALLTPSRLNLYIYVLNNSMNLIDPLGLLDCYIDMLSISGGIGAPSGMWAGANIETGIYKICCRDENGCEECRTCAYVCYGVGGGVGVPIGPISISGGAQAEKGPWFGGNVPPCGWGFQVSGMAMAGKGISGAIIGSGSGFGIVGGGGAGLGASVSGMRCYSLEKPGGVWTWPFNMLYK
jgi:RHS repeat-associated protein